MIAGLFNDMHTYEQFLKISVGLDVFCAFV